MPKDNFLQEDTEFPTDEDSLDLLDKIAYVKGLENVEIEDLDQEDIEEDLEGLDWEN